MLNRLIGLTLFLFLFIQILSGCLFFRSAFFLLVSYEIIDDDGFPSVRLVFNVSTPATITIVDPLNKSLLSEVHTPGLQTMIAPLGGYCSDPLSGVYRIIVLDEETGDVIHRETLSFSGSGISMGDVDTYWIRDKDAYTLVRINVSVMNNGDMVTYPCMIKASISNKTITARSIPYSVKPGSCIHVNFFVYIDGIKDEEQGLVLALLDINNVVLSTLSVNVTPVENTHTTTYTWVYKNKDYRIRVLDPDYLYSYYKSLPRLETMDYVAYIFDCYDDDYWLHIKEQLYRMLDGLKSDEDKINLVASFVQVLQYVDDKINDTVYEYPKYPVETLFDKKGDCEDKAILTATLLDLIGYQVCLIRLPNHMAVGVRYNDKLKNEFKEGYCFLETTRYNWGVGQVPLEYTHESNITIYPVTERPILIHRWMNATRYTFQNKNDFVQIKILVENKGSKEASFQIVGGFHHGTVIYNKKNLVMNQLQPNSKELGVLRIQVPSGVTTTLKTYILYDDAILDEHESTMVFT